MKMIDFDFDVVGGIVRVYAIGAKDVGRVTYYPESGQWRFSLKEGAVVIEIPVYAPSGVEFVEQQRLEAGADVYEMSLTVRIPKQGNALVARELERGEWIVVFMDSNGDIRMCGTSELPMVFASNRTITNDANYNSGVFSVVSGEPSKEIDRRAFYI